MTSPTLLDPGFSTAEMSELWTVASRVDAILDFEAALALALADAGLAPRDEAEAVAAACAHRIDDPEAAWAATWERGTPLPAILEVISQRLSDDEVGRWLHYGSTTQDAIDTAHMLLAARSLSLLETGMVGIARTLFPLMETHRHQPQIGRTFLQHARPTSFGFKVAAWLDMVLGHIEETRAMRSGLPVQLGGPVGDRADYGAVAQRVVDELARRLDLVSTPLSWHTNRTPVWELIGSVDRAVRSMAKVATDVALLASSEIAEVRVRSGGSSSMSGKRNPLQAIRALAAANACRGAVAMIEGAPPHESERGLGSWHVEWFALPIVFQTAAAVVSAVDGLFEGLVVDREAMKARVTTPGTPTDALSSQIDSVAARFRDLVGD